MRHLVDMLQMDMVRHSRDIYVMQREKILCARVNSLKKEEKIILEVVYLNEQIEYAWISLSVKRRPIRTGYRETFNIPVV